MQSPHSVTVPGTGWRVWRWALLRSAGFPADGLERFTAPVCATAADELLADPDTAATFDAAFDEAVGETAKALHDIAVDPRFRMAVTWQNPDALVALDGLVRDGPTGRRNARRRGREEVIAKYWQRYTAKNDTIGFFGPQAWARIEPGKTLVEAVPGPAVTTGHRVFFERWALAAVADALAAEPGVLPSLPVRLEPHLTFTGDAVRHPHRGRVPVSRAEAHVLALCTGTTPAADIAARLVATGSIRHPDDIVAVVRGLVDRGLVRWGVDLPMDLAAEAALHRTVASIADPGGRSWASAVVDRLCELRDAVAAAVDPDELGEAMTALEREFTAVTGRPPRTRPGETQAGRTLCHLESVRDVSLSLGAELLDRLTPLEPLLLSARWLTAQLAQTYTAVLREQYAQACTAAGTPTVPFELLWYPAFDALVGEDRPADAVIEDYLARWREVLGDEVDAARVSLTTASLLERVRAAFPATAPGWAMAAVHSPDLHLCPDSTVVLGELHVGLASLDTHFFAVGHPDPAATRAAMAAEVPAPRIALATPYDWPRTTAREAEWLTGPEDAQLAFAPAPGIDRARLLSVTALTVSDGVDGLLVSAPDGRQWPLIEAFTGLLWMHAFDTWKLAGTGSHTPRITVDGLVLARETWRTTAGETELSAVHGEKDRYLAVRRWRQSLNLPEKIFIRLDSQPKPCYLDLTSPVYARILCNLIKSATRDAGPETGVAVSEVLPGPEQAWLPDREGNRYGSELRLHLTDPAGAAREPPR